MLEKSHTHWCESSDQQSISTKNGAGSKKINHSINDNEHRNWAPTSKTVKNPDIIFDLPKA